MNGNFVGMKNEEDGGMRESILLSLMIAIVLTFAVYPGVLMTDSAARWTLAEEIQHVFETHNFQQLDSWLSATPSIFMALVLSVSQNIALFTFLQIFLFYFSIICILYKVSKNKIMRLLGILFFVMLPVFWGFSCYHEMSVWVVIGLNLSLLLLDYASSGYSQFSSGKKVLFYFLLYVSFYIGIGFRQNAFTVAPVLVALIVYLYKCSKDFRLLVGELAALGIGLLSIVLIPSMIGIHVGNSGSAGFVWEMLCAIQALPENEQEDYCDYLDFINGEGSTQRALLENQSCDYLAGEWLFRGDCFPLLAIGKDDIQENILKKYFLLYADKPQTMIKTKGKFALRMMGIGEPLNFQGYYENDINDYSKYGLASTNKYRSTLIDVVNRFMQYDRIFVRPWIWFSVAFVLFLLKRKKANIYTITLLLLSAFYMGAFFINTQGFLYRYFFPANCFLLLSILGMLDPVGIPSCFTETITAFKEKFSKPIVLYSVTMTFILGLVIYIISDSVWLDNYCGVQAAMNCGERIFEGPTDTVIYYDDTVIFIHEKNGDSSGYYYLHIYPQDHALLELADREFNTIDFYLIYKEIHTIGFKDKDIALIELPDYEVTKIVAGHTGSYDVTLNWESELIVNEHLQDGSM
ncbi:MAG: hypothetical protein NC548_36405 [Lachnospiraceae bacterium]|nr:hypothetical protein [Lachnospiraceae bacterium]MCM1237171.1 hypothetical protein [Ruminococcus flavefaciens]